MSRIYNKQVEAEYFQLLKGLYNKTLIKILVLGPNTKETRPGSQLRKYIARKCKGSKKGQIVPIYAERKRLIKAYTKTVGKYSDFCDYEKKLAYFVDAIVIIPDSAGSLVELGLFALEDDIHRKILVLFSNEYPAPQVPTFINLGPRKSYNRGAATVKDVDYTDKIGAWNIVDDFLSQIRAIVFSTKRLKVE